jgi:glycosyltransferase involved in cell wall biosynthesis
MRIAFFTHFYPPTPCGGAGYYTAHLAETLQEMGADVGVLCVDQWGQGTRYFSGLAEEVRNGVVIRRLHVNWKKASRPFDWLYDSPVLGEQSREFLKVFHPDIVHVSSCYTLSARPVIVASELGLPIIMHFHDYWAICARTNLIHKDNTVCSGPDSAWKCQQCLLEGTHVWQLSSAVMNAPLQKSFLELLSKFDWVTQLPGLRGMLGNLQRRSNFIARASERADVLITPTEFARDVLEKHGIGKGRIKVIPNGSKLEWAGKVEEISSHQFRIGFLGNLLPIKGVHVLIEAFRLLVHEQLPVRLEIWGDPDINPDYYRSLRMLNFDNITWGGKYVLKDLPQILCNLDVVVVPSIAYETHGIVIQEAFAANLPVIVSADSSLTESVQNEVNGLHFQMGSAADLASKLRRLILEPELLDRLRANIRPIRSITEDAREYFALYNRLIWSARMAESS